MSKYYTSKGDQGTTGLLGKKRVPKNHPRIKAVGAVDEATEALGFARACSDDPNIHQLVKTLQEDLHQIMSILMLEKPDPEKFPDLDQSRVDWLEEIIHTYEKDLPSQKGFLLPGDSLLSSAFGLARTTIRRAERKVVNLHHTEPLHSEFCLPYLNRLSSLCFVLELIKSNTEPSQTGKNRSQAP
jgi:cob(I)alamin adenosyltransferase